ncbi:MAG: hypothetical protein EON54_17245 [Alcaligenaceae bacterium]|nr:MAG: hypothetical protein EON54_17245 [Alcaligenaceae bacterium]
MSRIPFGAVRTVKQTDFETYLKVETPTDPIDAQTFQEVSIAERSEFLAKYPHCTMLEVSFAEINYANRWCWQHLGPRDGDCHESTSDYPACELAGPHSHDGTWTEYFFGKSDYNYGYCEWYFAKRSDLDKFLDFQPQINWGESYPK